MDCCHSWKQNHGCLPQWPDHLYTSGSETNVNSEDRWHKNEESSWEWPLNTFYKLKLHRIVASAYTSAALHSVVVIFHVLINLFFCKGHICKRQIKVHEWLPLASNGVRYACLPLFSRGTCVLAWGAAPFYTAFLFYAEFGVFFIFFIFWIPNQAKHSRCILWATLNAELMFSCNHNTTSRSCRMIHYCV